jgi:hypothetical protein
MDVTLSKKKYGYFSPNIYYSDNTYLAVRIKKFMYSGPHRNVKVSLLQHLQHDEEASKSVNARGESDQSSQY